MLFFLIHRRIHIGACPDRPQLILIADQDIVDIANRLDNLAGEVAALVVGAGYGRRFRHQINPRHLLRQVGRELRRKDIAMLSPIGQIGLFLAIGVDQLPHTEGFGGCIAVHDGFFCCVLLRHYSQLEAVINIDRIAFGIINRPVLAGFLRCNAAGKVFRQGPGRA